MSQLEHLELRVLLSSSGSHAFKIHVVDPNDLTTSTEVSVQERGKERVNAALAAVFERSIV